MTNNYIKTIFASALTASLFSIPLVSSASTVTIKNESDAELTTFVEPGEGKVIAGSSNQQKYTLKANEKKVIEVKKDALGDVEVFSIKGSVTAPSLYNRCTGLFMNKDYSVVFVPGKVGVICYASDERYKSE